MTKSKPASVIITNPQKSSFIRPLSIGEWTFMLLQYRNLFGYITVTSRYTKPIKRFEIMKAIKLIIIDNPWLLSNVFTDNVKCKPKDCQWRYVEKVELNDIVQFIHVNDNDIDQKDDNKAKLDPKVCSDILSYSLNLNNKNALLWKIIIVNEVEVCFLFNHGMFDAMSGVFIQKQILETLRRNENTPFKEDNLSTIITRYDLPEKVPHIHDPAALLPYSSSALFLLKTISLQLLPNFLKPKYLRFKRFGPPIENFRNINDDKIQERFNQKGNVKIAIINLNTIETENIIKACKKKEVTVTSFLNIAGVKTISKILKSNNLLYQTAVDLRRIISVENSNLISKYTNKTSKELIGFLNTTLDLYYDDEKSNKISFWENVSKHRKDVLKQLTSDFIFKKTLGSLVFSPFFPKTGYKATNLFAISKRTSSFVLSNLGYQHTKYLSNSKFNVERMTFVTYSVWGCAALKIDCITTNNNNSPVMTLSLQCGPNSYTDIEFENIKNEFHRKITDPNILMDDTIANNMDTRKNDELYLNEKSNYHML